MTVVTMPEASVDENNGTISWKHKIGFAEKLPFMQPKPETASMQTGADNKLRLGVSGFYTRHHATTGFQRHYICHSNQSGISFCRGCPSSLATASRM